MSTATIPRLARPERAPAAIAEDNLENARRLAHLAVSQLKAIDGYRVEADAAQWVARNLADAERLVAVRRTEIEGRAAGSVTTVALAAARVLCVEDMARESQRLVRAALAELFDGFGMPPSAGRLIPEFQRASQQLDTLIEAVQRRRNQLGEPALQPPVSSL